jgi:MoxR-like ATPase
MAIQFTPDLLPSDLTGINFFDQKENDFRFRPGPLFTNIILADEVNRATPRTQSALQEAMEEQQISVDGTTYTLKEPFMVMATQNPIESYGTFPLPEAQLDRFFMRISMGYMTREQELSVISRTSTIDIIESLRQVVSSEDTQYIKNNFHQVQVCPDVAGYIMDIIQSTREESKFVTGVSTRGAICLYKAAQVTAALSGRNFVTPEDVRFVAPYVLCHRISSGFSTKFHDTEAFLKKLIDTIPVPVENIK